MIKKIIILLFAINLSLFADYYYSGGKKHYIKTLKTSKSLGNSSTIVQNEHGNTLEITDKLIVSYSDINVKAKIENFYELKFIKVLTNSMYLYQVENQNLTLQKANEIYEEDGIEFSHPDFLRVKKVRAITKDPHADLLWHLKDEFHYNNAGVNIVPAWKYTKGEGVKVAIYDEGIDINHVELKENVYAFANYNDEGTNLPYSANENSWHGTAVAGILAASENNRGGVGIAPKVSLYAVRYSNDSISKDVEAFKWLMSEGVSVINNSWGTYAQLDAYSNIFRELATKGRDGKGIILIFASGNENQNLDAKDIHDESESPYVFSVAASTEKNLIADYSNYGSSIDFTAPGGSSKSGLFTIDATGSKGYNDSSFNYNFVGTSGSAPIVSGTVALMLAANPSLTRTDIYKILKNTSSKLGNYSYDENGHNIYWGYGKINAGRAVEVAISYKNSKLKNFARTIFSEMFE